MQGTYLLGSHVNQTGHKGNQAITQGGEQVAWGHVALLRGRRAQVWGAGWGSGSITGRLIVIGKLFLVPGKRGETLKIRSCSKPCKINMCYWKSR